MSNMGSPQLQVVPLTKVCKIIIIINAVVWIGIQIFVEKLFGFDLSFSEYFGFVPAKFLSLDKNVFIPFIWQPVTYMFLHEPTGVLHIFFNMLLLWWLGSELEVKWGSRFFTAYYFVSGIGAALIYLVGCGVYYIFTSKLQPFNVPVIGASGAIFGLMVAYGILYGERVILFMFLFPMKAKFFVMVLAGMEIMMLLANGLDSSVANLAHIGGLISGFLFLMFWANWSKRKRGGESNWRRRKLKLVVNNETDKEPKYWN